MRARILAKAVSRLVEVSSRTGVPVGFGLLTCDTLDQALDRAGLPGSSEDKGFEAAVAAVAAAVALRALPLPASVPASVPARLPLPDALLR